ncbi:hypothetical protein GCM10027088_03680 [Nocardia goodfellowii]|uniref:Nudix hydrolase domain-containing protein n=1 Tax=Nocardia goodfellowii TaxID=882446 RepID=A0ABS4QGL0_9NOCA|nr:hypothetical protein [Nocardia goodfellowii]
MVKEVREEAGLTVEPRKLVAALDRDTQGHPPPLLFSVLKMYYLCDVIVDGGVPDPLETAAVDWFYIDELPPLSTTRILEHQIQMFPCPPASSRAARAVRLTGRSCALGPTVIAIIGLRARQLDFRLGVLGDGMRAGARCVG